MPTIWPMICCPRAAGRWVGMCACRRWPSKMGRSSAWTKIIGNAAGDAATTRFDQALSPLPLPRFDALPALRAALPGPDVFFQQTVHLTPRGHDLVAAALEAFIRRQGL